MRPSERAISGNLEPYADSSTVYRCVRLLADNGASVPWRLYSGSEESATEIRSGPWFDLFARPAPSLSFAQILWLTIAYRELDGEAFWLLHGRGDRLAPGEIPSGIQVAPGSLLRDVVSPSTNSVEAWELVGSGGTTYLAPWEVVPFLHVNPRDPNRGLAPLRAAAAGVSLGVDANQWNRNVLRNSGLPTGVVKGTTGVFGGKNEEQEKRALQRWESRFGGVGNARRVAILPEGTEFQETGFSPRDMDWIESLKWSRQDVATVYGIPLFLLAVLGDVHRETSREARKLFWKETVKAMLVQGIAATIENALFYGRGAGRNVASIGAPSETAVSGEFDFSGIEELQPEQSERLANAEVARRLGVPWNEIIRTHGLPYEEDPKYGDEGVLPMGLAPVSVVMDTLGLDEGLGEPTPPEEAEEEPETDEDEEPTEESTEEEEEQEGTEDDEERALSKAGRIWRAMPGVDLERARAYRVERMSGGCLIWTERRRTKRREKLWQRYVREVHRPGERKVERSVGSWLRARGRETLAAIRKADRAIDGNELLRWLDEQEERWAELMRKTTRSATVQTLERSLAFADDLLSGGLAVDMAHPATQRILAETENRFRTISGHATERVRAEVRKGLSLGEGLDSMQKRIARRFNIEAHHALTIARTETGTGAQAGLFDGSRESGVDGGEWLSAGDEEVRTDPPHNIDGERRPIGEPFSNGLIRPHDPAGSAKNVINCRCSWMPFVD
jgi:HK97 family phage portal protein